MSSVGLASNNPENNLDNWAAGCSGDRDIPPGGAKASEQLECMPAELSKTTCAFSLEVCSYKPGCFRVRWFFNQPRMAWGKEVCWKMFERTRFQLHSKLMLNHVAKLLQENKGSHDALLQCQRPAPQPALHSSIATVRFKLPNQFLCYTEGLHCAPCWRAKMYCWEERLWTALVNTSLQMLAVSTSQNSWANWICGFIWQQCLIDVQHAWGSKLPYTLKKQHRVKT